MPCSSIFGSTVCLSKPYSMNMVAFSSSYPHMSMSLMTLSSFSALAPWSNYIASGKQVSLPSSSWLLTSTLRVSSNLLWGISCLSLRIDTGLLFSKSELSCWSWPVSKETSRVLLASLNDQREIICVGFGSCWIATSSAKHSRRIDFCTANLSVSRRSFGGYITTPSDSLKSRWFICELGNAKERKRNELESSILCLFVVLFNAIGA